MVYFVEGYKVVYKLADKMSLLDAFLEYILIQKFKTD